MGWKGEVRWKRVGRRKEKERESPSCDWKEGEEEEEQDIRDTIKDTEEEGERQNVDIRKIKPKKRVRM